MKSAGQQGFTLLELLTVLAVVGVLAAIAIPQFLSYRDKAERAALLSDTRYLYRAFVIYYLEQQSYPNASTNNEYKFHPETFAPLTTSNLMGGLPFEVDLESFRDKLDGRKAEKFDSPDDLGNNQEFYVILPWAKDPTVKFVVAAADNISYQDGTPVAGGAWLDGVYITKNGNITYP